VLKGITLCFSVNRSAPMGQATEVVCKEIKVMQESHKEKEDTGVHHLQESDSVLMVWTLTWKWTQDRTHYNSFNQFLSLACELFCHTLPV